MPRIQCRYEDCIFLEGGYCTADRIELDPEMGCLTFQQVEEVAAVEWEEEDAEPLDDEEEEEELEWDDDEDEDEDDDKDEW